MLVKATLEHDIIIHAATADDEDSVRSIVKGLSQKPKDAKSVYIHTSGTGVLTDPNASHGNETSTKFYSDIDNKDVDSLPDSAYHRNVDLIIKRAVDAKQLGSSKVAIMLPPLIYGLGTGPFNRTSIQVPGWAAESAKAKQVTIVGKGIPIWNNSTFVSLYCAETELMFVRNSSRSNARNGIHDAARFARQRKGTARVTVLLCRNGRTQVGRSRTPYRRSAPSTPARRKACRLRRPC